MIREFPLPDLGEGLTESEIVAWRVAVGDRVELNQIIADVETAKAVVELPSPYAGVITALHAAEGETVERRRAAVLLRHGRRAEPARLRRRMPRRMRRAADARLPRRRVDRDRVAPAAAERDAAPGPNLVGYGARDESGPKRRARRAALAADLVPADRGRGRRGCRAARAAAATTPCRPARR